MADSLDLGNAALLAQGLQDLLIPMLALGLLFYFLLIRPEKRKQSQHRAMLEGLKKNDRVVTIGGIRGTIVSIRREADEVVIKVDDNAKLRMTISAIARLESSQEENPAG